MIDCIPLQEEKEIWKPVVGYEGLYEVSDLGRVRNAKTKKIRSSHPNGKTGKYLILNIKKTNPLVHRLVAKAFVPNPEEKPCVNHINNKKHDNRAINLDWVSYQENTQHGLKIGNINKNRLGVSTVWLDSLQKKAILILCREGIKQRQIAQLLNISETTINSLIRKNG